MTNEVKQICRHESSELIKPCCYGATVDCSCGGSEYLYCNDCEQALSDEMLIQYYKDRYE